MAAMVLVRHLSMHMPRRTVASLIAKMGQGPILVANVLATSAPNLHVFTGPGRASPTPASDAVAQHQQALDPPGVVRKEGEEDLHPAALWLLQKRAVSVAEPAHSAPTN